MLEVWLNCQVVNVIEYCVCFFIFCLVISKYIVVVFLYVIFYYWCISNFKEVFL